MAENMTVDIWDDLLHRAEMYSTLTHADRERFSASPREAWAWLTTQLEKEGWAWTATSGYAVPTATIEGPGNRIYTRKGRTPLAALLAAFVSAARDAREAGIPRPE